MIRKVLYFFFSLVLSFLLSGNESFIPDPPSISSSNYILIDANTNRVLAEMNPDEEIEPASITKIMTGYVVSDQIQDGFITLDDEVLISENCWRKKGSRMFIEEGSRVVLLDLIKGMVIQSGNDATCAIAEHVAGSEDNFVDLMMRYAEKMALDNTSFINPSGWPDTDHYSSAKDIAKLSTLLIKDFPEHYSLYKEKWFTYNNIRQRNRNALLWQDDSIDGLKTGHTESAGFCLVSSGTREQTRLIAVTLKSKSEKTRLTDNRRLLDYGFRYFRTKKLVTEGQNVKEEQVWGGELEKVAIAPIQDFYLTLPLRDFKKIESFVSLEDYLQAPISKNQIVGKMLFKLGEEEVGSVDLVTVKEVKSQGVFGRAWSNIKLLVYRFLMEEE
ncbi:MAG TPA: D-alanyl-D-alanine carboxypeptidase [Gammaproteobacteria bacterium]|jgi:D-alanyl-D-alanine carboxypeptidase (penicillin-binding protein 5/6)|nr:D-alanyl-D-alanine carboxypeptidase [Gammaproteobacteria bacterium]HIO04588.1 D-alanyl-D-alanine carboxypeptidase [Gammaproteobacteria bacterium]